MRNQTRAPATSEPTTAVAPTIRLHAPMSVKTRTTRGHHIHLPCSPPVPVAGVEPARPTGQPLLRRSCLPIPPHWQKKRGAETNTSNNHATTVRPTSGTHAHQPHHRPAQPACADTLNRPTQTGPTYSPTPRAPWRKHPSATRTHPAHHQCRHTPLRDSTRSREHPRVVSAPRSA